MTATADEHPGRAAAVSNMLLPGLLAWVATLAVPVAERGVSGWARVTSGAALVAMVAGPLLLGIYPRVGRIVGIQLTVAFAIVTWVLLGPVIGVQHLEPVRAAIGGVAWVIFAFGWGSVRDRGSVPEEQPGVLPGAPLPARAALPFGAAAVLTVGVIGAALPIFIAWRVTRPSHALFAHGVAVVCAIALVTSAAMIAVERQSYRSETNASARFVTATRPLTALALAVIIGCIWLLIR